MAQRRQKGSKQLRQYLIAPVNLHHADLPLLACCFVTGIIDAGAYNAWGTFMGMQTGKHSSAHHGLGRPKKRLTIIHK